MKKIKSKKITKEYFENLTYKMLYLDMVRYIEGMKNNLEMQIQLSHNKILNDTAISHSLSEKLDSLTVRE